MVSRSFPEDILQFSRAIDTLQTEDFYHILEMVRDYLNKLKIHKVELLLEATVQGQPGLEPQDWDDDRYGSYTLYSDSEDGEQLNGQVALCFTLKKPLWIINPSTDQPLPAATICTDLWSGISQNKIPQFNRFPRSEPVTQRDRETLTLIAIPTHKYTQSTPGVIYFESEERLNLSSLAKKEFLSLSEGLSDLYDRVKQTELSRKKTGKAITELRKGSNEKIDLQLFKSTLFFAYPGEGDSQVIGVIRDVLDGFSDKFEVIDWKEVSESGNINQQIFDQIQQSKYSLCYFSEMVSDDGNNEYKDNPNVLFEAGMIHVAIHDPTIMPQDCILVRETPPPEKPFDFSAMRLIQVNRYKSSGKLNEPAFSNQLKEYVETMLKDD